MSNPEVEFKFMEFQVPESVNSIRGYLDKGERYKWHRIPEEA